MFCVNIWTLLVVQPSPHCRSQYIAKLQSMCVMFPTAAPKNEDAYEISIPFEENNFEQSGSFYSQPEQSFEGGY